MTSPAGEVGVEIATPAEAALLANLMQLYIHDLSVVFPDVPLGPDGRFSYPKLPLYWSEPDRRYPFLIRCGAHVAGFILVTRGSPVSDDPETFDIAEFFVMRRYRRTGVGRRAAALLWSRLPGEWTVRVTEANGGALAFWEDVVQEAAAGRATVSTRPGPPAPWRIYAFDAPAPNA